MAKTEVSAKHGESDKVKINFDFGENLEDMAKKFGDEVAFSYARSAMTVAVQDVIRSGIKAEKTPAQIQREADNWKPGVKKRGKSKAEKLAESFAQLSDDDKKAMLARLSK